MSENGNNEIRKRLENPSYKGYIRLSVQDKMILFTQIATICLEGEVYSILKPKSIVMDMAEDEVAIFILKDTVLELVTEEAVINKVIEEYYSMKNGNAPKNKHSVIKNPIFCKATTETSCTFYKTNKLKENLNTLHQCEEDLSEIIGQGNVVEEVCQYLYSIMDKKKSVGPKATMLFIGPPGVGKTSMAELIAKSLGLPKLLLSMTSFSDKEANFSFSGSNRVYKDSRPGMFTKFVDDNPKCVVIFDEIEKCHKNTLRLFLQALDKGFVKDLYMEKDIDLSECIMIFTSNVGKNIYDKDLNKYNYSSVTRKVILEEIANEINPVDNTPFLSEALVSRFSESPILLFNRLSPISAKEIVRKDIDKKIQEIEKTRGIKIQLNASELANNLIYTEGDSNNIRSLKGSVKDFFNNQLVNIDSDFAYEYPNEVYDKISFDFTTHNLEEEIKPYFNVNSNEQFNVLIATDNDDSKLLGLSNNHVHFIREDSHYDYFNTASLDLSAIIIDISKNSHSMMNIFDLLIEREYNIPIYIYTNKRIGKSNFNYFINKGCEDYYTPLLNHNTFKEWISEIIDGLKLSSTLNKLKSNCKSLKYDYKFNYNKKTKTVKVMVNSLKIQTSVSTGDNKFFVPLSDMESISFDDIVGGEHATNLLKDCVDYLKNNKYYRKNNISIPKGAILFGDPGIGKTLRAKAIAKESGLPFISVSAVDFFKTYVGQGSQLLKDIFSSLRKYGGVLFIDEFELIASVRDNNTRNDYHEITNTLLAEMDGFSTNSKQPFFVIGATNFDASMNSKQMDRAVLRRFDYKIKLENPNKEERKVYLNKLINKKQILGLSQDSIVNLATRTSGWSFSDLSKIIEEFTKEVFKKGLINKENQHLDEVLNNVFETIQDGDEKQYNEEEIKNVSYHEAGHAFVSYYLGKTPDYVTIKARGNYGGYVLHNNEDKFSYSRDELLNQICETLAGRAAEEIVFKNKGITTGASSDLSFATNLAIKMYKEFAMCSDNMICLPNTELDQKDKDVINQILKTQYGRAMNIIQDHFDDYEKLVQALTHKKYLLASDFEKITMQVEENSNANL